jgi:anti-anti-sigma factor
MSGIVNVVNNFQVLIHEPHDGVVVFGLSGELDMLTAKSLQDASSAAVGDSDYRCLVFDLTNLTFMDSTGLHILAQTHQKMTAAGRSVRVVNESPRLGKLFELTGLDSLLTIVPDRDSALALAA